MPISSTGRFFSGDEMYITLGRFAGSALTRATTPEHIYYRSIRREEVGLARYEGFHLRWDNRLFWCSKNLFVQNPFIAGSWTQAAQFDRLRESDALEQQVGFTRASPG